MIGCAIRGCVTRWVQIPYSCALLSSVPAGERMVIKRQKPGQDVTVIKKPNGGSHRLTQAYMAICQENRWNKVS